MPRVYPPRRTLIAVRLALAELADIDARAKAEGVDRSAMVRTLLGEALTARQRRKTRDDDRERPGLAGHDPRGSGALLAARDARAGAGVSRYRDDDEGGWGHHPPCRCGCGELADECAGPRPSSPGSMTITLPRSSIALVPMVDEA